MKLKYIDIEYNEILYIGELLNKPCLNEKIIINEDIYQVNDIEWNLNENEVLILLKLFNNEIRESKTTDNDTTNLKRSIIKLDKTQKELDKKVSNLTDDLISIRSAVKRINTKE
jgi:hypothetical protein